MSNRTKHETLKESKDYKDSSTMAKSSSNRKSRRGRRDKSDRRDQNTRLNDANWYVSSPELANQLAQLSFQEFQGATHLLGHYATPTILKIEVGLCPGVSTQLEKEFSYPVAVYKNSSTPSVLPGAYYATGRHGVNLMADKFYTLLSSFTGRTASYAPQDVAMMLMAVAATAEWVEFLRRAFGIALTYNPRNRSLPEGLLNSMGLDVADFRSNLSIYRTRFNMCIARLNQLPLLSNIAFIKKSRDIFQFIYADDNNNMAQYFYYAPKYWFSLEEDLVDTGTILRAHQVTSAVKDKMSEWLAHLEYMTTKMLESSTLNFIYADILNMANKLHIETWQFDYLAENYVVLPQFNQNATLQLHNLIVAGNPAFQPSGSTAPAMHKFINVASASDKYWTEGGSIFSDVDTNSVIFNPVFDLSTDPQLVSAIVDFPTDNPAVEDKIEAMRFSSLCPGIKLTEANLGKGTGTAGMYTSMLTLPDHYVTQLIYFQNVLGDSPIVNDEFGIVMHAHQTASSKTDGNFSMYVALNSQLEHGPLFYNFTTTSDGSSVLEAMIHGQLQFYTEYDYTYLSRINDAMFIALFDFRV